MCYQPPGTDIWITFKSSLMRGRFRSELSSYSLEASPHKRRHKCDTNISPRRLMTHLLHQMVHHRTTLRGNGQWSATIARITTKTHTTTLTMKGGLSESCAIRTSYGWPYPQARLGARRYPTRRLRERSLDLPLKKLRVGWVRMYSASPTTPTEGV